MKIRLEQVSSIQSCLKLVQVEEEEVWSYPATEPMRVPATRPLTPRLSLKRPPVSANKESHKSNMKALHEHVHHSDGTLSFHEHISTLRQTLTGEVGTYRLRRRSG